jgi:hypothetical protein
VGVVNVMGRILVDKVLNSVIDYFVNSARFDVARP